MDLQISKRFAFHPADTKDKQEGHALVRSICRDAAQELDALLPDGREKATCITKLQEAMMHANAAVAINGGLKVHEADSEPVIGRVGEGEEFPTAGKE